MPHPTSRLSSPCKVCATPTTYWCNRCHVIFYCTIHHAITDWPRHRRECISFQVSPPPTPVPTANVVPSVVRPPMSLPSGYTSRVRALLLKPSIEHVQYITIPYRVTFPTAFAEVTPEVGFYFTECEPQYTLYTKGLDGRVLRNPFQIWYCPNSFKRFSPVNHPVARLAHGLARKAWYGPVVILKYSGILRQSYWDVNEGDLAILSRYFAICH
ncbi:hypothetical protein PYCCODRAFT_1379388 [Trametes coccinea BRFM310]|uniref:MYND-type domain-containing protein n=1 Tax=Trametes coccinea (strain BRFM310) TaxID=1353009 RepID=A0A1Y2I7F9_TRAC3|nr:hypothetical protein PYCCODRAFT_1379388 [Trametes coccinea BRFM310]